MGQADDPGRGRHAASPVPPSPDPHAPVGAAAHPADPAATSAAPPSTPGPPAAVPGRHRAGGSLSRLGPRGRWPVAALAVVAVVAVVAVALMVVVVATSLSGRDPGTDTATTSTTSTTSATGTTTSGDDLAAWARAQLPPGATLAADPTLAAELAQSGAEIGTVTTDDPAASGADGPVLQVVRDADPAGRTVVARFADADGGALTVVDPAAEPPDEAELERRRQLGAALLANPMTAAPPDAAQRLRDGQVDPRLLSLLAGMAARFGVQLADLPAAAGEETGAPARAAVLSAVHGDPVAEGTAALDELRAYLAAQLDTFAPDEVQLVEGGLLVRFRYVTDPDGAVTAGGG